MLNTKNTFETFVAYCALIALGLITVWQLAGWPTPDRVLSIFLASDAARELERFQILLGLIAGAGLIGLTYYWNAHRERRKLARTQAQTARNHAHGLALEAEDLIVFANAQIMRLSDLNADSDLTDLEAIEVTESEMQLSITDNLGLLDLSHSELADLGAAGHTAINETRHFLRRLEQAIALISCGDCRPQNMKRKLRAVTEAYAGIALAAERCMTLFTAVHRSGVISEKQSDARIDEPSIAAHIAALTAAPDPTAPTKIQFRTNRLRSVQIETI